MPYTIYTDTRYRYHMIGEESLAQINVPIKIAYIGFLKIKYYSPLKDRKFDLFSFMCYLLT